MDVIERIKTMLATQPVLLFMKGTPQFPMCEYSERAVQAMQASGAAFATVNVLADPEIRASLPRLANWHTFPQLFLQGEWIGGCDVMEELNGAGQLARMLHEAAGSVAS